MRAQSVFMGLALALTASPGVAQMAPQQRYLEVRPLGGAMIPAGKQQDVFESAAIFGLEAAYEMKETFHLVGSFEWSPGKGKFSAPVKGVDILQYDLGIEFSAVRDLTDRWEIKPFLGVGAGVRSFMYEDASLDDLNAFSAYGALGTEFQYRPFALRLQGRLYNYSFKETAGGGTSSRTDVGLSLGVAYHLR